MKILAYIDCVKLVLLTCCVVWFVFSDVEKTFAHMFMLCFVCRGRHVEADQGRRHPDLWAG